MERLSKLEILNETVQFYSEDVSRRSKYLGACVYNGDNGSHCAVGRCFTPSLKAEGKKLAKNQECDIENFLEARNLDSIDSVLDEKYHGHNLQFWTELQRLHDLDIHWTDKGLSEMGEYRVNDIKEKFGL